MSDDIIGAAHSIRIHALQLLGQMRKDEPKNTGAMGIGKSVVPQANRTHIPTLKELGLDKKTSALVQQIASLPARRKHCKQSPLGEASAPQPHKRDSCSIFN